MDHVFKFIQSETVKSKYTPNGERPQTNSVYEIRTVGDLKALLENLPEELPLTYDEDTSLCATWYNLGKEGEHLELLEDNEQDMEDEEEEEDEEEDIWDDEDDEDDED